VKLKIQILSYGQSEYVRSFGLKVETNVGPLEVQARVLQPPTLKYGQGSKQATIVCLVAFLLYFLHAKTATGPKGWRLEHVGL
jgi:Argonaute linker 2 domain